MSSSSQPSPSPSQPSPSPSPSSAAEFPASKYRSKAGRYTIPVQFWNKKQKKAITLEIEVDTGSGYSIIGSNEAKMLDIDIESGEGPHEFRETAYGSYEGSAKEYHHDIQIRLGNLPWITEEFLVVNRPTDRVIGYQTLLDKYRWIFSTTGLSIQKYATEVMKFKKGTTDGYIYVYNVENGKEVKVPVTIDTGSSHTHLDNKYKRILGVNDKTIKNLQPVSYMASAANWFQDVNLPKFKKTGYNFKVKLGKNLKPIMIPIWFDDLGGDDVGMLAIAFIMSKDQYNITFEKDRVKYEEVFYGTLGVSNSARNYRRRYM